MNRFWKVIIEPVLQIVQPKSIVEIGSADGKNTANLMGFCEQNGATLHAIDPLPKFDVAAWEEKYGKRFIFHQSLSLNAIPQIDQFDVVLIDGDHNWYTVFNELKLIENRCTALSQPFPLVMIHDIGWPYGRRDLYYNPENIPEAFRKPHKKAGIRPDSPDLLEEGGLNRHLYNSIYENDLQNGVLTAVEDFLKEPEQRIQLVKLPGLSGLGILVPMDLKGQKKELSEFLKKFELSPVVNQYFEMIENERSNVEVLLSERYENLERAKLKHQKQLDLEAKKLTDKDAAIANYNKINENLKNDLLSLQDAQDKWLGAQDKLLKEIQRLRDMAVGSRRWKLGNAIGEFGRKIMFKPHAPTALDELAKVIDRFQESKTENIDLIRSEPHSKKKRVSLAKPVEQEALLPEEKRVSVIILNRNGSRHLKNLFESYLAHRTYQNVNFIVVDHASSDDSIDTLLSFRHQVDIEIILCDSNQSFAFSNNMAAKKSTSEYLFFLNNDIIFQSDPIPQLVNHLDNPDVGLVGIKLLYPMYDPKVKMRYIDFVSQTGGLVDAATKRDFKTANELPTDVEPIGKIQHAGIRFFEDITNNCYRGYNLGEQYGRDAALEDRGIFPAVTAAAMLCRREEFLSVGGFCEEYVYGMEDVDLCLTYMFRLHKAVCLADELSLVHNESATQKLEQRDDLFLKRKNNWAIFKKRFGYLFNKAFRRDKVSGHRFWSDGSLTIAFAVTEADENAKAGDYFTALELGSACEDKFGWSVKFLSRHKSWYDLKDVDVLVVMVDAYDLSKTRYVKPGLVKIAWLRNWFDRWAERPCFDDYDIYLCSSKMGTEFIEERGKKPLTFPIATNENRFKPKDKQSQYSDDYCFTGHKWGVTRDIEVMLDPTQLKYKFAVYGNNWDNHDKFGQCWKGFVQYDELPSIYSSTRIVIDDVVNDITKPWGSVNSRVFDALSCGALVITNDVKGSKEIFEGKLPVYETAEELQSLLNLYLGDENARLRLVEDLRKTVRENHTYTHRAYELQSILTDYFENKFRIAIKVPVPKKAEENEWGDYHFALALKRAFVKLGHSVRIDLLHDWDTPLGFGDNVVIVLRGLSKYRPKPEHINLMWNISHPDKITSKEYELYDHIFVASQQYADKLSKEINKPVTSLLQCTDTNLFYPEFVDQIPEHEVLFVGNSRKQYRPIVKHTIESGHPVGIYGTLWEKIVPKEYIKGTHIKNTELRLYYSKCGVLLNDHWPSMGERGFISNRIFDAGACGACVVSDEASGMSDLFGDAVVTYRDAPELKRIVKDLLSNGEKRKAQGEKLRDIVSKGHSFEDRVKEILKVIEEIHNSKKIEFTEKYLETGDLPNSPQLVKDKA